MEKNSTPSPEIEHLASLNASVSCFFSLLPPEKTIIWDFLLEYFLISSWFFYKRLLFFFNLYVNKIIT